MLVIYNVKQMGYIQSVLVKQKFSVNILEQLQVIFEDINTRIEAIWYL